MNFYTFLLFQKSVRQRGFTLLLAALVSSLVLSLGLLIVSIVRKSIFLSSLGRDSQFAFYVADGAAECALYWDIRHNRFSTSTPPATVRCNAIDAPVSTGSLSPVTFSYQYEVESRCVKVSVVKNTAHPKTVIHADGYNVACAAVSVSNRALQRSVELQY